MAKIDSVGERERLARRYLAMGDLELQKVGREPEALTEWARNALKEEMEKRGLQWSPDAVTAKTKALLENESLVPLRSYANRLRALSDRTDLQSAEIESFFYNEGVAFPDDLQESMPPVELKLLVRAKDLEAAKQYLEQKALLDSAEEGERIENEYVADQVPSKPVILRTYRDMPAAYVAKSVLDAAGIRCFLQDANVVRMDWLWSNAVGGFKLVVSETDATDAAKILDSQLSEEPADSRE